MQVSLGPLNYLTHNTLGYERIFDEVERLVKQGVQKVSPNTYPPHNLIRLDDTHYIIEVAVAGFRQDELDVVVDNGSITIVGERKDRGADVQYIYRGIGARNFTKTIALSDTIEVKGATFENGILTIGLENVIRDTNSGRKVTIGKKALDNFYPKAE